MASPENSAAPATPSRNTGAARRPSAFCASAISERMPPSPRLSALIRKITYFRVTVKISAKMSSEIVPTTASSVSPPALACASDSRSA